MTFFQKLQTLAFDAGLEFLVIGGLAVNFYGVSRETADLDLLVCRDHRDIWCKLLSGLNYTIQHEATAFIQFSPPQDSAWPVDFMLVAKPTFDTMVAAAREVSMYQASVKIPTLTHLLAMKLHALKHSHARRFMKDYLDVENLVRANQVDLQSEQIRASFLKYGDLELYEKIKLTCAA